jgi:hypothetical protein
VGAAMCALLCALLEGGLMRKFAGVGAGGGVGDMGGGVGEKGGGARRKAE